jgi:superfamily II DNA/RNA helicase
MAERFSPLANKSDFSGTPDEVNILVATDVMSEGLNLQDGDVVVNYDLHWNPVRLIQRFGRIDRIGTENERIWGFNFLPETELEKGLGLHEILRRRISEIHESIGEDAAILTKTSRLTMKRCLPYMKRRALS